DALITTIEQAISGDTAWQTSITEISMRHQTTLDELISTTGSIPTITTRFATAIAALKADLQRILVTEFATEEARAHAIAAFSGWGERLSVLLFAQALAGEEVVAAPFEGEPVAMVERQCAPSRGEHNQREATRSVRSFRPSVAATRELLTTQ